MAITNNERVGKALDLLKTGLEPFVRRELEDRLGKDWGFEVRNILADTRLGGAKSDVLNDVSVLLVIMDRKWGDVFRITLGKSERSLVNELIDVRNRWAHQKPFSGDDAYRALDSAARLLNAVSAGPQADELEKSKQELLRVRYDEQARGERRKVAGSVLESSTTGGLKPWREIVTPHEDVAGGRYQQAEFAAEPQGYTATRHQREVGTSYFDAVAVAVSAGKASTTAMAGSTETEQFHDETPTPTQHHDHDDGLVHHHSWAVSAPDY